ncbi:unnamed protein product [Alopecurus aequalis]
MAPSRSAKRPSLSPPKRGDDDYVPGNIVEIELRNFMTYDRLVCRPGPRLNLVVGPNGSGKSSLVCAIELALAADPSVLGRAASVGAFVKRGEDSGHVTLSLRGHAPGRRDIRKIDTNNKSEWLLDGATVPKKEITDVIKNFNIQVNNLTQFLPQDRVCEFAKLTPIQLLEETEKAVGDPDLPVQHRELIERSKELRVLEVTVKQMEQTLTNLKALNAEQEKDVQRVRQRDKLMKKVELMKKKLPWLRYDMKKLEFVKVQEEEKIFKKKMEEATKIWRDAKAPIELKQMENKNDKLLQALKRTGADKISEAYYWVQDNKNMFKREVYGPVLLESLLVEAVALKWSSAEKNMAFIELDQKIWEMEKDVKKFEKDAVQAARDYETPEGYHAVLVLFRSIVQLWLSAAAGRTGGVETTKGKWLPTLRTRVLKINDTFSRNFQEMAVAGEVSLDEHGLDFGQYGILIKVKFRETSQLQVLSAHHQSGGEQSVSTILYLVSLQDLTNCPFRVVDEINQGMDPVNERKMFQQLVRAASQLNTPQCFLLTPKLLPDLEYSDACSILNVMNGPWIEKPAQAWSAGDCWRKVMCVEAGN